MAISTIREFTAEDADRVNLAAERFCKRHGIRFTPGDQFDRAELSVEYAIECQGRTELRGAWTAAYCRALRVPRSVRVTVAFGYIGRRVD